MPACAAAFRSAGNLITPRPTRARAATGRCQSSDWSLLEQRLVAAGAATGRLECRATEGVPLTLTSRAGTTR